MPTPAPPLTLTLSTLLARLAGRTASPQSHPTEHQRAPGRALVLVVETFPAPSTPGRHRSRSRLGSPKMMGLREGDWDSSHLLLGALGPQCAPEPLSTLHRKQPDDQGWSRQHLAVKCRPECTYVYREVRD